MKIRLIGATAVLSLSALAGCGGSGNYCDIVTESEAQLKDIDAGPPSVDQIEEARNTLKKVSDAAPSEISDDWKVAQEMFDGLFGAFDSLGLSDEDLKAVGEGDYSSVDPAKVGELMTAFESAFADLDEDEIDTAFDNITKYTKDECGIDLDE